MLSLVYQILLPPGFSFDIVGVVAIFCDWSAKISQLT